MWVAVFSGFVLVHSVLFSVVDNVVDTRACIGYSPDPLYRFIPFDTRWTLVTYGVYLILIPVCAVSALVKAVRGVHTLAVRWTLALTFMTLIRMGTVLMIPMCRPTVSVWGPAPLAGPQMVDLHMLRIPWRVFTVNDMVYSGHTAIFLLLLLAAGSWCRMARIGLVAFMAAMIYGLLATRDHYTVDILLAFPCGFFADYLAVRILRGLGPRWTGEAGLGG